MNPAKNCIPATVKNIHLIGICGTAMGAVAVMLKQQGYTVSGSDQKVYPPMSTFLAENGITVLEGFSEKYLAHKPDLVIVGNVVRRNNPEACYTDQQGLFYCSMPQAINHFIVRDKIALMVTGTHGKTTTSSLLSWILDQAGLDPSFLIGGILSNYDSNYRLGNGSYVVLEGDEYDTAFFDKGPKFMHYKAQTTILTNVEFDHADIYGDLSDVQKAFGNLLQRFSDQELLLTFDDHPGIDSLMPLVKCRSQRYGFKANSDWQAVRPTIKPPWTLFDVYRKGKLWHQFKSPLMGQHNLSNSLAAIGAAADLGISRAQIAEALVSFKNVKRRQEIRGVKHGITVMDDFAHHPTAVKATIAAVKPFYPDGRLIAVFEPRTNTSRRNIFQEVYPDSFNVADHVLIKAPMAGSDISQADRFSAQKLASDIKAMGIPAKAFCDSQEIVDHIFHTAQSGDIILVMSNGGFDNLHNRLLEAL